MKLAFLLLTGALPACASHAEATAPSEPRATFRGNEVIIKTTGVAGNIYMLEGAGGNIGVSVGEDGVILIDDQFAPLAPAIRQAVKNLSAQPIRYVINTHFHGDHTGGNPEFGTGATIVAHTNVRKRLSTEQTRRGEKVPPLPQAGWPQITFDHSVTLHLNGETVEVLHFPTGHTDGDSVIFFSTSNVIHMGDHFFVGRFPFVDLASGGNVVQFAANVGAVLKRADPSAKIIPGHGPLASVPDLRAFHSMLVTTIGLVRERLEAGQSKAEIQTAGLPPEWKSWGEGFIDTDTWLGTVATSLE